MERKWIIAIAIIVIVIVGFSGWYFLYGTKKAKPVVTADVTIDSKDYTIPLVWNLTAVPMTQESHNITNAGNNATSIGFNYTIWRLEGTQWVEQFNGTKWIVNNATVTPSIFVTSNVTGISEPAYANKSSSGESATYYYSLIFNDKMIYLNLNYLGSNPTIDGRTVFAYAALDVNGNGTLNPSDKAFNLTSNPSLSTENELEIFTPENSSSWNTTSTDYYWNGNVSSNASVPPPITVLLANNRTDITFAIPFSYIGATSGGHLDFVVQAFSHDWVTSNAKAPTLGNKFNYIPVPGGLVIPSLPSFAIGPHTTQTFYTKAVLTSAASGEYSIVFEFQATVQNS